MPSHACCHARRFSKLMNARSPTVTVSLSSLLTNTMSTMARASVGRDERRVRARGRVAGVGGSSERTDAGDGRG